METQNESAAPAADDGAAASAAATTDGSSTGVQDIGQQQAGAGTDEVSEEEIIDLRKSALEEQEQPQDPHAQRFVTLGDTVYYGEGNGQVFPATVVHVYVRSVEGGEIIGSAGTPNVDLQVFKRKQICDVENVSYHQFNPPRALNGWIFKA